MMHGKKISHGHVDFFALVKLVKLYALEAAATAIFLAFVYAQAANEIRHLLGR